jgi:H+/Na+-translocating ferredoxin:NAD+ oxidoreductase subunit B
MSMDSYEKLARHLDALPNGFPRTESGAELRLLARIFTPEEAELAAQLRLTMESPAQVAERIGGDAPKLRSRLKDMALRGLIDVERGEGGLVFGALPFVVGIFENQIGVIDQGMAQVFEAYYREAFGRELSLRPQIHRVIPVEEAVEAGMEIRPYESAAEIIGQAKAWGVLDCICRKQKALLGDPCPHPVDVCMAFGPTPNYFDHNPAIRVLTQDEALGVLRRASEAGLVHSVANSQQGVTYICNCCTCSCGILRGLADLGLADVVARSAFVTQVRDADCVGCDLCLDHCQFQALSVDGVAHIDPGRCVGCGVCALSCPEGALVLVRREPAETLDPPLDRAEWRRARALATGRDLEAVL